MDRIGVRFRGALLLAVLALLAPSAEAWPFDAGQYALAQSTATGAATSDQEPPDDAASDDEAEPSQVESLHAAIAGNVKAFGAWMDSYFSDEQANAENNKTRVRVMVGGSVEKGSDPSGRLKLNVKLALPKLSKRLSAIASADGDNSTDVQNTANNDVREHYSGTDKQNTAVGLQYRIHSTESTNASAILSMRIHDYIPVGIVGGRVRQTVDLDPWRLRLTQSVLWYTDNGFSLPSRIDLDRMVTDTVMSRTNLRGDWYESEDGYYYEANQWFIQSLGPRRSIAYEWNNHFRTKPSNRLEETNLRVRYRRAIYRDWLYFDLAPQLSFPRDRDFDATPGIYAGFEIRFGV